MQIYDWSGDYLIKNIRKIISLCLSCVLITNLAIIASAKHYDYSQEDLQRTMENIVKYYSEDTTFSAGTTVSDWYAFAIARCGFDWNYSSYISALENDIVSKYKTDEKLSARKATEWHRISMTMLALGADPTQVGNSNINLIADGTYNRALTSPLSAQGVNGSIWALICLDGKGYSVPDNAFDTRESIIVQILENQLEDGSFTLDGETSDNDVTAMALQALSSYYDSEETYTYIRKCDRKQISQTVREVINKALDYLSSVQCEGGDFSQNGEPTCETTSQVVIALCSLGIDPANDNRFIKNNSNTLDGLMKYKNADGGFSHTINSSSDFMSCEQALNALCAVYRFNAGLSKLYDLSSDESLVNIFTGKAVAKSSDNKNYISTNTSKIKSINDEISRLYPFDKLTSSDEESINQLIKKIYQLDEADKAQIVGFEDLKRAKAKLDSEKRSNIITAICLLLAAIFGIAFVATNKKRMHKKKETINDEW